MAEPIGPLPRSPIDASAYVDAVFALLALPESGWDDAVDAIERLLAEPDALTRHAGEIAAGKALIEHTRRVRDGGFNA